MTKSPAPTALIGKREGLAILICFLVSICLSPARVTIASDSVVASNGISVRDSIEMTRLVDPSPNIAEWTDHSVKYSPGGSHFAVVTRKGNLHNDAVTDEILVFNVEEIRDFFSGGEPLDTTLGTSVASLESTPIMASPARPAGVSGVRWLSDSTLAFIGQRGTLPTQVYSVDISTRELIQLTDHDRHIRRFDASPQSDSLLFVADDDGVDQTTRDFRGYAVGSGGVYSTLLRNPSAIRWRDETYYFLNLTTGQLKTLTSPGHSLVSWFGIWLSPTGRWAITLAEALDIPTDVLVQYAPFSTVGEVNKDYEDNPALHPRRNNVRQYVLIDTATGATRPLLRAPISWGRPTVHWASDGRSVIVSNTHLPLRNADIEELSRRRNSISVVEIDIETGQFSQIDSYAWEGRGQRVLGTQRPAEDVLIVQFSHPDSADEDSIVYRRSQQDGKWVLQERDTTHETTPAFSVFIAQDMNTPPDIAVTDNTSGRTKLITNFNPKLRERLGRPVERFEWTDENGRSWVGGLLYPPDYRMGQRYPLVIQTYGFSPDEFLIDGAGSITSAFAARPLASSGMVVLQMSILPSTDPFPFGGPEEGPSYVAGFEGAVRALDERGTIDPERVGLIGWSRTGLHVSYAVTFSELTFAAATIADSTSHGLTTYMMLFGTQAPGVFETERAIGAPFWGENRHLWLERSPNLNAHRVRTPLRFELYSRGLSAYWDMYTVLRRHYRPAEMFHIPIASHVLQRPLARYASQQGNVDWFAFWLTGYEDSDPSKAEQYRRWRKLRQQHTEVQIRNNAVEH